MDPLLIGGVAVAAVALYLWTGGPDSSSAFAALADAFLHGRLSIDHDMPWLEIVPVTPGGHDWYVPLPPVPAVVLLPFVAVFGPGLDVGIIVAVVGGLNVVLLAWLLSAVGVPTRVQAWLAVGFALGSVEWWAAGMAGTHLDAQVWSVFFALLALNLAVRRRWPLLGGLLLGLAAGARIPVGLTAPLYLAFYGGLVITRAGERDEVPAGEPEGAEAGLAFGPVRIRWPDRDGLLAIGWLVVGVAIVAAPVALYNLARFGDIFDFGYTRIPSSFGATVLDEPWYAQGLNCLCYIPRNLHAMFIRGFDYVDQFPWLRPNWTATSLLITTPIFLWLVKARALVTLVVVGWIAVALGIFPDITHGGVGWTQFGYRRILDVAPILWLLLGWVFRNGMSLEAKAAVILGVLVNAYGIWAITVLGFVSF